MVIRRRVMSARFAWQRAQVCGRFARLTGEAGSVCRRIEWNGPWQSLQVEASGSPRAAAVPCTLPRYCSVTCAWQPAQASVPVRAGRRTWWPVPWQPRQATSCGPAACRWALPAMAAAASWWQAPHWTCGRSAGCGRSFTPLWQATHASRPCGEAWSCARSTYAVPPPELRVSARSAWQVMHRSLLRGSASAGRARKTASSAPATASPGARGGRARGTRAGRGTDRGREARVTPDGLQEAGVGTAYARKGPRNAAPGKVFERPSRWAATGAGMVPWDVLPATCQFSRNTDIHGSAGRLAGAPVPSCARNSRRSSGP